MFSKIFKKSKKQDIAGTLYTLTEKLRFLEKKEQVFLKKVSDELEQAKAYTKKKNKKAAMQCLKKKKLYELEIEKLGNYQLRIHDQMLLLEAGTSTIACVEALRTGASAIKSAQKEMKIKDIDKTMNEINEQTENMKQIQEALSAPFDAAVDFDEDELDAELEELEGADLEEQFLQPASNASPPQMKSPAGKQEVDEVEELTAVQADLAL